MRREDKNRWERRAPLTPRHVIELTRRRFDVAVQPSSIRVFPDEAYRAAGAAVTEDLSGCSLVLGVKEIPQELLLPGTTYAFFSHVVKGQRANMPMLRRLMDLGCSLVDYERIADDRGRRLVFFGRFAGLAGMLDALWALGRRLDHEGIDSPFAPLKLAHEYADLDDAYQALERVAAEIRREGVPEALRPLAVGFTGSGNASRGAQDVFDRLPHEEVSPDDLPRLFEDPDAHGNLLYKVLFARSDRVARADGAPFDPAAFAREPGAHAGAMGPHLARLTVLVNGIYWTPGQPRVVALSDLERLYGGDRPPRLRVIADISCDIGGSIEATVKFTTPGDPVFVYDVRSRSAVPGVDGRGPVILAIDNLPCELPVDASEHFGDALSRFVPALARCDWTRSSDELDLPEEIRRALVVHRGRLTPPFAYLDGHLAARGAGR